MALAQNAKEEVVGTKMEPLKLNPTEYMGRAPGAQPQFKPKPGTLIPARRRSVKSLMFDYVLHLCSSSASEARNASDRRSDMTPSVHHNPTRPDQINRVYPYPPEHGNSQN